MEGKPAPRTSIQAQHVTVFAGVLILLIVVLQNVDTINVELLYFDLNLPLALLLAATLLIGMAIGFWLGLRHRQRASS